MIFAEYNNVYQWVVKRDTTETEEGSLSTTKGSNPIANHQAPPISHFDYTDVDGVAASGLDIYRLTAMQTTR